MLGIITKDPRAGRWQTLACVMLARLLLLLAVLTLLTVIRRANLPDPSVYLFFGVAFGVTIAYAWWLRHDETVRRSSRYQFAVDVFIISGLVHFTGGAESQLSLLYPLVILAAAVVVSGALARQVAILSVLLYLIVILLEMSGVLPYTGPDPSPYLAPETVVQGVALRVLIFVLFTAASSYLADRVLLQDRQLERLQLVADSILDNVSVPLVAVRADGVITQANPAAADLLGLQTADLRGRRFADFFPAAEPPLAGPAPARVWEMRRPDGTTAPVSIQTSPRNFALPLAGTPTDDDAGLRLVALRDLSDLLDAQNRSHEAGQRTGAAGAIAEMVDAVRNPLTAIRGAGELLATSMDTVLGRAREITGPDWQAAKAMCEVICEQTRELDRKVEQLLVSARTDPDELGRIARQGGEWAGRILPADPADPSARTGGAPRPEPPTPRGRHGAHPDR